MQSICSEAVSDQAVCFFDEPMTKSRGIRGLRIKWTPEEVGFLVQAYPSGKTQDIAAALRKPLSSVYYKANKVLGLKKGTDFLQSSLSGRVSPETCKRGVAHRFRKGQPNPMKGKRRPGRCGEATRFKKGQRPFNWVPVGSERISSDGIRQRKVSDTGFPPRDWQSMHSLIWIKANGPIPPGHLVAFRDGDRANIVLENLELVSRGELMLRNTIHRYPAELKDAIRLIGKVGRTIKRIEDEKQTQ